MIQPFLRATLTLCISLLILSGCGRDAEPQQDQAPEAQVETAAASTADSDCKLGVQLYSFRHDLDKDLPRTLARVKQLGIDCIEPYSLHGLTPEALRAEFDKAGLRVVSYHLAGELFRGPPEAAVNIARVLGAEQVGVAWIKESENDAVDEAKLMKAADQLNAMCPAAQAAGVKVFYHTHGYEFHEGDPEGKLFDKFVQALTPECVVLQLDVYWVAYAGQDPVKLINRYADRTLSLHIKDMAASQTVAPFDGSKWSGPLTDESFAVIGQGKLDWPALFEAAKAANVRWYIIEDETTKPYDAVTASLPFLKEHGIQ